MTKILFVSDIHLNLKKNKKWEENRFKELINFLDNYEVDIICIGGDIFDLPSPSLDELYLFYQAMEKLGKNKEIYLYGGNHENLNKNINTFDLLPQVNYKYFDITYEPIKIENINCYFVSHNRINEIDNIELLSGKNVLFSHIRAKIGVIKAEYNIRKLSKNFDEVFLGDIHIPYDPFYNVHYCGSPYTIQYDTPRDTGIFEIIIDNNKLDYKFVNTNFLPQKVKLNLTIDEFNNVKNSLNKDNLYKIYVSGYLEDMNEITCPDNVELIFENVIGEDEINEQADKIISFKNTDIVDVLYKLVEETEGLSDISLEKGKILLDNIKKEMV